MWVILENLEFNLISLVLMIILWGKDQRFFDAKILPYLFMLSNNNFSFLLNFLFSPCPRASAFKGLSYFFLFSLN